MNYIYITIKGLRPLEEATALARLITVPDGRKLHARGYINTGRKWVFSVGDDGLVLDEEIEDFNFSGLHGQRGKKCLTK